MKRILVACEESQAVTIEFRKLGFEAYSCDIQECSGGHPEWHIQGDAIEVAYGQKWAEHGTQSTAKGRSKTFPGIAKAMAEQWGSYLLKNPQ